jgi:DNA invertase Pin-like site-specific DNA recombinase
MRRGERRGRHEPSAARHHSPPRSICSRGTRWVARRARSVSRQETNYADPTGVVTNVGNQTATTCEIYKDAGISGAKGRNQRPGLDTMLKDAGRRKFDVVMAWAIDRLGRSLIDLLGTIQDLEAVGVDLYLDQQHLDTTTPTGKLLFHVTGAFSEFERSMIRQRVNAGLSAIKAKIRRDGHFTTKAGIVRRRLGRPGADPKQIDRARHELAKGLGIGKVARLTGLGTGTVHKIKRQIAAQ